MRSLIIGVFFSALFLPVLSFGQGLTYDEQVFDFGHVGIDFKVNHTFTYINQTNLPIKILDLDVTCDCTTVHLKDSLIEPGDTAKFDLLFETKDYLGPTNKSFRVITDNPANPILEYFYLSIVGQWYNGIKPDPVSLFFLPGKKEQIIRIPNKSFNELSIVELASNNDFVEISYKSKSADKNKLLEISVAPSRALPTGTFYSTISILLEASGLEETKVTIPVKIVKY